MQSEDEVHIQRCIELAKFAIGKTSPNPYVGCVITIDGRVVSEGYHKMSGSPHAELDAINKAKESLSGSTVYTNLEPCCHTNKKTPPCAQRLIKEGVSKVVVGSLDPNPLVAGKGIKILKDAGIEVTVGVLKEKCDKLNEVFFKHIIEKRPFIHLKWAQTLDGKVATKAYSSKWITNDLARLYSHKERNLYDAILVGSNTLNKDDPSLTIRVDEQILSKKRIILSNTGEVNLDSKLFNDEFKEQTVLVIPNSLDRTFNNINTLKVNTIDNKIDLVDLMKSLYNLNVKSIYVEGGAKVINSFLTQKLFDRVSAFIAPKLIGEGISVSDNLKKLEMNEAHVFESAVWTIINNNILLESSENICLQD